MDATKIVSKFDPSKISFDIILDESKSLAQQLICKLCSKFIQDPVCCNKCLITCCYNCISNYFFVAKTCPNNCDTDEFSRPCHLLDIARSIRINCYNKEKGCKKTMNLNQIVEHIEAECQYENVKCNICVDSFKLSEITSHILSCSKKNLLNNSSNTSIYVNNLQIACEFCKIVKEIKIHADHTHSCDQYFAGCHTCYKMLKDEFKAHHPAIECLYNFSLNNKNEASINLKEDVNFSDFKISVDLSYDQKSEKMLKNNFLKFFNELK